MELQERIKDRRASIAVIGLGYVGLPLSVEKAKAGFQVFGVERNAERVVRSGILVFDTRNATAGILGENVIRLGVG